MTPKKKKTRTAILISGRGSNMAAIIAACQDPSFPAEVVLVISNRPEAKGLEIAQEKGVKTCVVDHETFDSRAEFEAVLHHELCEAQVDLICLAGFMRILDADFVRRWRDRLINIHPSLLPSFRGLHTHERVLEQGAKFTGCTVHFVTPEMDDGPIIIQAVVPVLSDDTTKSLEARVMTAEHQIYPEAIRLIGEGRVRVSGGKAKILAADESELGLYNPLPHNY